MLAHHTVETVMNEVIHPMICKMIRENTDTITTSKTDIRLTYSSKAIELMGEFFTEIKVGGHGACKITLYKLIGGLTPELIQKYSAMLLDPQFRTHPSPVMAERVATRYNEYTTRKTIRLARKNTPKQTMKEDEMERTRQLAAHFAFKQFQQSIEQLARLERQIEHVQEEIAFSKRPSPQAVALKVLAPKEFCGWTQIATA